MKKYKIKELYTLFFISWFIIEFNRIKKEDIYMCIVIYICSIIFYIIFFISWILVYFIWATSFNILILLITTKLTSDEVIYL